MAESKKAKVTLTSASLRDMKSSERITLLAEKRTDLFDAKRSLAARELANPRRVTALKKEIALILTVENEVRTKQATDENQRTEENA